QAEGVSDEVDSAALPARALEHRRDGPLQALVGIADHQLDPGQAARNEGAQELVPERAVLARADVEPEHLPLAVAIDSDREYHRHRDDPPAAAHLHETGIQPDIRVSA